MKTNKNKITTKVWFFAEPHQCDDNGNICPVILMVMLKNTPLKGLGIDDLEVSSEQKLIYGLPAYKIEVKQC